MTRASSSFLIAAGLTMISKSGFGQTQIIGAEPSCVRCLIAFEKAAVLDENSFNGPAQLIARNSEGTVYLVDPTDRMLKAFAKGGLVTQFGNRGGGPGEYEIVRNVLVDANRQVHVIDAALARRSVYSPQGAFLRSNTLRLQGGTGFDAVLLADDGLVINARPTNAASPRIVMVDRAGTITQQADIAGEDWRKSWLQQRLLRVRRNGDLVAVRPYEFEIDIYSPDLKTKRSFIRAADWIPKRIPSETPGDGVLDQPYTARVRAMWEDNDGRIWLYSMTPARSWKPGPSRIAASKLTQQELIAIGNRPRVESIIDVIDFERGALVASSRFPGPLGIAFGEGFFALMIEDSTGVPRVEISHAILKP